MQNDDITQRVADLCTGILKTLYAARKANPREGGAVGSTLAKMLGVDNLLELQTALTHLQDQGLVEMGKRTFQITAKGVDAYLKLFPPESHDSPDWESPSDGPPFWKPQDGGPDDPSHVPRKQKPSDGGNAVALPLPETQINE